LLPAYGREGQGQHFLAAHFAKRNTKNCGGEKARAGREFLSPPNPLSFPPRPSGKVFCSAVPPKAGAIKIQSPDFRQKKFGFCKRYRQFTISAFLRVVASPSLRSGSASAVILKGNLKSKNNFCPLKRKFAERSSGKMKFCKPIFFSFAFDERQSDNFKYFDCLKIKII